MPRVQENHTKILLPQRARTFFNRWFWEKTNIDQWSVMIHITSYYPRSTTDVWKGYFYKHQVDFFGSRRCLRRPGFDSYFAPIIKFIRPDYYQCFLSNRDIMVFFGQLTVFLSLDLFCCYGCRACFFGTSQHITCSQSVFASVVPHQLQPIFPCQLWKNPSVLEPQRWCQQWQQNLLRKQKPPQTPGRICERSLFVPTIIFSGSYHMEGDGG